MVLTPADRPPPPPAGASASAPRLTVDRGRPPEEWDQWARALGGGPFHCAAWARYRVSAGRKQPLFLTWWAPASAAPVALALGVETVVPGPVRASSIEFDAPPATRLVSPRLVADVERWMRTQPGVADAWLGSFDAQRAWTDAAGSMTRLEFRITPAPPDELLAGMRTLARRSLRRALRRGVEVDPDCGDLPALAALYQQTLDRLHRVKGLPTVLTDPAAVAERLAILTSAGSARLFLASAGGVPVAGALFTVFGGRTFYLSGGSNERGRQTGAMTAVLHRAVCEFSAAGVDCINLGGVPPDSRLPASPDHGLHEFKRGLGGVPHPCHDARIVVRPVRRRLLSGLRAGRTSLRRVQRTARRRACAARSQNQWH